MLPNVRGPRQRLFISGVARSILRYAASVSASTLKLEAIRRKVAPTYGSSALRTSCTYRTTPGEGVCVIPGIGPIGTLAILKDRLDP